MSLFGPPNVERLKAKGDIKGLIKALGYEKDSEVRKAAAQALGEIGDTRAVEPLIEALNKDNWGNLVIDAAKALGELGDTRAVEPLIAILKKGSQYERIAAAEALSKIGDARGDESLLAVLMDPELDPASSFHNTVVWALIMNGSVTYEQIVEIITPYVTQYREDMDAIAKSYPFYIKTYYESYKSKSVNALHKEMYAAGTSTEQRMAICIAWGSKGTDQAKEELGAIFSGRYPRLTDGALCEFEDDVRRVAGEVLRRLGSPAPKSLIAAIEGRYHEKNQGRIDDLIVAIGGQSTDARLVDSYNRWKSVPPEIRSRIEKIRQEIRERYIMDPKNWTQWELSRVVRRPKVR